ncbi:sodium/glucose cotransporter 2-like [Homarus americanus]|uniref:sodium/glucose cotransporter 2-like n=1 Tax=Homarus americanus TaxID=6706 RepID=UPI001C4664E1|nr:sodium/glucose cotransporter 2-like [Homarus americanus]
MILQEPSGVSLSGSLNDPLHHGVRLCCPVCGSEDQDKRPEWIKIIVGNVHYLHFGCILFLIVLVITIVVSYLTEPIPKKCIQRLTYWTRHSQEVRVSVREWRNETQPKDDKVELQFQSNENSIHKSGSTASTTQEVPAWRRCINCVCGVDTQKVTAPQEDPATQETPEEKAKRAAEFLEKKTWTNVVDGLAILIMTIAGFVWGFYA